MCSQLHRAPHRAGAGDPLKEAEMKQTNIQKCVALLFVGVAVSTLATFPALAGDIPASEAGMAADAIVSKKLRANLP
jgi:hypothetical protein